MSNKTHGAYVESITENTGEYEALFIDGTRMYINEVIEDGDYITIIADVL